MFLDLRDQVPYCNGFCVPNTRDPEMRTRIRAIELEAYRVQMDPPDFDLGKLADDAIRKAQDPEN